MALRADPKGYYGILGVAPSATAEEIRVAFRDAAKRYHPDNNSHGNQEKFNIITGAYKTLSKADKRAAYDATYENQKQQLSFTIELPANVRSKKRSPKKQNLKNDSK